MPAILPSTDEPVNQQPSHDGDSHAPIPLPISLAWTLLWMRASASLLLLQVHGLPKLLNWDTEILHIEDPLGLGAHLTLALAIVAEVICPVLIILGLYARLACLPILAVLVVSLGLVHPEWTLEEGQFAWLLLILFTGLLLSGPGPLIVQRLWRMKAD